ncbi:ABC transporter permease [Paenibacillus dendritiformis]|uniref:ABC transporter permease n=1 Tax=Paenibacillus dendritiformis TaxID=130049 RepID=UPI00365BBA58
MTWMQAWKMAWRSILANKMRTLLTMLGIVIGVSAVIIMVSVGEGSAKQVQSQVASLGSNLISVTITGRGAVSSLTLEEALAFEDIDGVEAVSPFINGSVQAKAGTNNANLQVEGITPEYEAVRDYHVQSGRFILPIDVELYQRVAIIGADAAETLFPQGNPLGQQLSLNGISFRIVGVMASKGSSIGGSNDNKIWVPLTRGERLLQSKGIRTVYVKLAETEQADSIMAELESRLSKKFRGSDNSYNQADMIEALGSVTQTMTLLLAGIASISLLVGGIGIMNIMLVSVTERTREIGIRKSLGAKKRDIMQQFLLEAVTISSISGALGIAAGLGGAYAGSKAMGIPFAVAPDMMWLSFAFSAAIGIVFGLFPANKAANLKPVDALRYD